MATIMSMNRPEVSEDLYQQARKEIDWEGDRQKLRNSTWHGWKETVCKSSTSGNLRPILKNLPRMALCREYKNWGFPVSLS